MKVLLDQLRPGLTVYVPGGASEPLALHEALRADPERAAGVHFVTVSIPGVNVFDYAALTPTTTLTTFMRLDAMRASHEAGRVRVPALGYSSIVDYLEQLPIDLAVLHVAPNGSFGLTADFGLIVAPRAGKRV
ncbi:MAG: hypothetical protein ABW199_11085, partial [Caulobacterales bacterium]